MTVNFGTEAQATALTIFAPSFAIPPRSALEPTMKPVTFTRNRSGIWRCEHSSMKCVALSDEAENKIPLLRETQQSRTSQRRERLLCYDAYGIAMYVREPG